MTLGPQKGFPPVPYRAPPQCPVCGLDVVYGQQFVQVVEKLSVFELHAHCARRLKD